MYRLTCNLVGRNVETGNQVLVVAGTPCEVIHESDGICVVACSVPQDQGKVYVYGVLPRWLEPTSEGGANQDEIADGPDNAG